FPSLSSGKLNLSRKPRRGSSASSCLAKLSSEENCIWSSTLNNHPSTINSVWHLHEFDRCPVWVLDVNDAFPRVRPGGQGLRFTSCFPPGCCDSFQNCVEIINN